MIQATSILLAWFNWSHVSIGERMQNVKEESFHEQWKQKVSNEQLQNEYCVKDVHCLN